MNIDKDVSKNGSSPNEIKTPDYGVNPLYNDDIVEKNNDRDLRESAKLAVTKTKGTFLKNFQQQTLPGWYFIPTVKGSLICTGFIWLILIIFGSINVIVTSKVQEVSFNYTPSCNNESFCVKNFTVPEDIEGPVFFYYGIKYFYQNHRDYVKSISFDQVRGVKVSDSMLKTRCTKTLHMSDVSDNDMYSFSGFLLSVDDYASPCGLIAKSFFNDTFALFDNKKKRIPIENNNLIYSSIKENVFKRDPNYARNQYIDVENEHFMVWTQFSTTAYWNKLWGRIQQTLKKGEYYVEINNNYNVSKFEGDKSILISNSSFLGGRNRLLGGFLIVFGGLYFIGFILIFKNRKSVNQELDMNLDWKK